MAEHMRDLRKGDPRLSLLRHNPPRPSRKKRLCGPIERLEARALLSAGPFGADASAFLAPALTRQAANVSAVISGGTFAAVGTDVTAASPRAGLETPRTPPAPDAAHLSHASSTTAKLMRVTVVHDIVYHADRGNAVALDLYMPIGPKPAGGRPAVVAFPGGGWRYASKKEYGSHISVLAKYGYEVAVADYTYSSGAPGSRVWPVNFEDVRAAVVWVRQNAQRLGVNPDKIAAAGVSSGAYMASMLGTYPAGPVSAESLPANPTGPGTPQGISPRVQAVVDFYGPTDLPALYQAYQRDRPWFDTFLGGPLARFPNRYQAASPINFVSPDDPPFLILQGTSDQAVAPNQSVALASALEKAGVPHRLLLINGAAHGFEFKVGGTDVLPDVVAFLDQALNGKPITTGQTTLG
jgi:acetyl esterase/lipase